MAKIISIILMWLVIDNGFSQNKLNIHQFPEPDRTPKLLFYIQRSLNSNTILYDANFDEKGLLDKKSPIDVYWIRYEEEGQKKPINVFEKQFAFGADCEELINSEYDYKVTIAAWDKKAIYIKQVSPFKVIAFVEINGAFSILEHIFIGSDPQGSLTSAEYIEIYGEAQKNSPRNYERILL